MALMPESWLKNAIKMASEMGSRKFQFQKLSPVLRFSEPAWIAAASASISVGDACGRMRRKTRSPPSASWRRLMSQRGLSGIFKHARTNPSEGKAATPNIQRQAFGPAAASKELDK